MHNPSKQSSQQYSTGRKDQLKTRPWQTKNTDDQYRRMEKPDLRKGRERSIALISLRWNYRMDRSNQCNGSERSTTQTWLDNRMKDGTTLLPQSTDCMNKWHRRHIMSLSVLHRGFLVHCHQRVWLDSKLVQSEILLHGATDIYFRKIVYE